MEREKKLLEKAFASKLCVSAITQLERTDSIHNRVTEQVTSTQFGGQSDGKDNHHHNSSSVEKHSFIDSEFVLGTAVFDGFEEHIGADFSCLPEVVWGNVLHLLDVWDRLHVALTCSRLHRVVENPSLWESLHLDLSQEHVTDFHEKGYLLPWQQDMVQRFGHAFQHVTISSTYFDLKPDSYSVLAKVAENGNLLSFTVHSLNDHRIFDCSNTNLSKPNLSSLIDELCEKLPNAVHLNVEIPLESPVNVERILNCPNSDSRCKCLKSLKMALCYFLEMPNTWCEQTRSTPTAAVICKFPSLQHLHLRVSNMSDFLLTMLSDVSHRQYPLQTLMIEFSDEKEKWYLPEISSAAWSRLVSSCPDLEVSCKLRTVIPWNVKAIFKPEVPLISVCIICEHEDGVSEASLLLRQHSRSLRYFEYDMEDMFGLFSTTDADRLPLVKLIRGCPNLQHLVYGGHISCEDILQLAMLKRKWKVFQFLENRILIEERHTPQLAHIQKDSRQKLFEEFGHHVSELLGYSWKPLIVDKNSY